MSRCKDCMHCTRMEIETWNDDHGIFSEWMCECFDGSWHCESDDSKCPEYIEDMTRAKID